MQRVEPKTVLVIDDDRATCEIIAKNVSYLGHRAAVAADGREALDLLTLGEEVDLIVTDLRMPELGGVQLISRLKDLGFSIPVVVVTGYRCQEIAYNTIKLGVFDILIKPFSTLDLRAHLRAGLAYSEVLNRTMIGSIQGKIGDPDSADQVKADAKYAQEEGSFFDNVNKLMDGELGSPEDVLQVERRKLASFREDVHRRLRVLQRVLRDYSTEYGVDWGLGFLYRSCVGIAAAAKVNKQPAIERLAQALAETFGFYVQRPSKVNDDVFAALKSGLTTLSLLVEPSVSPDEQINDRVCELQLAESLDRLSRVG